MNTDKPTYRCSMKIGQLIAKGKLTGGQMFSIDRYMAVFQDIAITITSRVDACDLFFIMQEL